MGQNDQVALEEPAPQTRQGRIPLLAANVKKWSLNETVPFISVDYTPAQRISMYQFSPPQARVMLFSRWEFGLVLGYWHLGRQLKQPLLWLKPLQSA